MAIILAMIDKCWLQSLIDDPYKCWKDTGYIIQGDLLKFNKVYITLDPLNFLFG